MIPLKDDQRPAHAPVVTLIVISACVAVFFRERTVGIDALVRRFALFPAVEAARFHELRESFPDVHAWEVWRLVVPLLTSMFLHGDWLHLIGNMWFLWVFGPALEGRLGSTVFALAYLGCGAAAGVIHTVLTSGEVVLEPGSLGFPRVLHLDLSPVIGASGAIAGVLGAYFVLFPRARIFTFLPPLFLFALPAVVFLALWFALQYFAALVGTTRFTGVAYGAHVGGFLAGMLLAVTAMVVRPREFVR